MKVPNINLWKFIAISLFFFILLAFASFYHNAKVHEAVQYGYNQGTLITSNTGMIYYQEGNDTRQINIDDFWMAKCQQWIIQQQGSL